MARGSRLPPDPDRRGLGRHHQRLEQAEALSAADGGFWSAHLADMAVQAETPGATWPAALLRHDDHLVLGAGLLLGLLWLPLAPLPFLALNRILGEADTLRRAWRVRRRQTDLLVRWPAHAVAEPARLIAAGKTLPDLPGEGPTVLLVSRRAANDEDDAPEAIFLPAQDGAHARLALGAEAETPEGQARIAAIARDLLEQDGPGPLLLSRDARGPVLFGPDPESDGTRPLAIRSALNSQA